MTPCRAAVAPGYSVSMAAFTAPAHTGGREMCVVLAMRARLARLAGVVVLAVLGLLDAAVPCFASSPSVADVAVRDARGVLVAMPAPARRIVALAPSLAEAAYFAGAGARLVGVSSWTRFPAGAATLPVVAAPGRIDLERVTAIGPDLVLGWQSGNRTQSLDRIAKPGRAVFVAEPRTLLDLGRDVRAIGVLAGSPDAAERAAGEFERALEAIRPAFENQPRVFIEISAEPLMTVNDGHLIADIVRHCGGTNVFGHLVPLTPRISMEQLLIAQPDVLVASAYLESADERARWARARSGLRAVRDGRVLRIDGDLLHQQSFRVIEAVRAVCQGLRPPPAVARAGER